MELRTGTFTLKRVSDLHCSHSATGKTYAYMLDVGAVRDPFMLRYSQYVWRPIDVQAMRCACSSHDDPRPAKQPLLLDVKTDPPCSDNVPTHLAL